MAVKYRCTKCDRKFIEWGVEKVKSGAACEDCHGEYLEQVGYDATLATPRKKPSLKRKRARAPVEATASPIASYDDDDAVAPDLDSLTTSASGDAPEEADSFEDADAGDDTEDEDDADPVAADDEDAVEVVPPVKDEDE